MAYKTYGVTSPPTLAEGIPGNVKGTGRSKPFVKFEIFDFLICFGCIFVLFLWQQQDFRNFWGGERGGRGGHFKIQTKSIWKIYSYFRGSTVRLH